MKRRQNVMSTGKPTMKDIPEVTYEGGVWKGCKVNQPAGNFQLGEKLITALKRNPDTIGQIDGKTGNSVTFRSIHDKSVRCALWLKKFGIRCDDVVGYCSANNMNTCIPLLATFYIGSIFNPWWYDSLDEEITRYFIKLTRPKVVFIDEEAAKVILKVIHDVDYDVKVIVFGEIPGVESFTNILCQANVNEVQAFECTKIENGRQHALILYTSGTTGNPKGALHTYESVVSMIRPTPYKNAISLWFANLCWGSGFMCTVRVIVAVSTVVVYDSPSERVACDLIEKYKITRLSMGTSIANRLSKLEGVEKYDMSSVNFVFFAGSITTEAVVKFLINLFKNATITTTFGSAECQGTGGVINPSKLSSCVRVFPDHEIKVIDLETNKILGPHEQGEICSRGSTMMKSYWNNPSATNEAIDSDGWYHTGDIGYYDNEGDFFIIDRIKELIKYRNTHIQPAEIECVIHNIPGVAEVAIVGKPSIDDAEQPTAFITKTPGAHITENDVHKVVDNKLHDKMKLRGGVYFLDEMPRTASGKISKRKLRALAKAQVQS